MRETFDEALPAYSLGEDYDLGCASNATALPADMIAVSLFISGHQAAA